MADVPSRDVYYKKGTYAYGITARSPTETTVGFALNSSVAALPTESADTFSREANDESGPERSPENSYEVS